MHEILGLWVSNGSIRVNLEIENVSIITHDFDLENRFPGDPLIPDMFNRFYIHRYIKSSCFNIDLSCVSKFNFSFS